MAPGGTQPPADDCTGPLPADRRPRRRTAHHRRPRRGRGRLHRHPGGGRSAPGRHPRLPQPGPGCRARTRIPRRPGPPPGHPVPVVRRPAEAIGWFALSNEILQPIYARSWLRAAPTWNTGGQLADVLGRLLPPAATTPATTEPATTESGAGASTTPQPLTGESAEPGDAAPAPRWYLMLMGAFTVVMGVIFAATGTAFHRWTPPWGIVIALVAVAAGGVLARTFA